MSVEGVAKIVIPTPLAPTQKDRTIARVTAVSVEMALIVLVRHNLSDSRILLSFIFEYKENTEPENIRIMRQHIGSGISCFLL